MGCFKFLTDNLADADQYANLYESSEQSSFPATNVLNKVRRTKVWRTNGYFKVTSSNNVMIFRDASGGADKTATITVGEYVSTTTFMAAVDTAMEAAGVANYTITQSSNYKFVITSDLSGGATAFELRFADGANTCETLLGFAATNLSGASTYTSDFLTIATDEWLTFDLGVPEDVTDFVLIGARNSAIQISSNATIKLQGNLTNEWSAPLYDTTLTYDDQAIAVISSTALYSTQPLRYWRCQIVDQNPSGYVQVGGMFLGVGYEMAQGSVQFPLQLEESDLTQLSSSEGGQVFADILPKSATFSLNLNALSVADVEEIRDIFDRYGTGSPFYVVMDTSAIWNSTDNRSIKYVMFEEEPAFELVFTNFFRCSLTLKEQL